MHLRYLSAPKAGDFELRVQPIREGGLLSILGVSLRQDGRECLSASVCFSAPLSEVEFQDIAPPAVCSLEEALPLAGHSAALPLRCADRDRRRAA